MATVVPFHGSNITFCAADCFIVEWELEGASPKLECPDWIQASASHGIANIWPWPNILLRLIAEQDTFLFSVILTGFFFGSLLCACTPSMGHWPRHLTHLQDRHCKMDLTGLRTATMTPSTHGAWVSHVPVHHEIFMSSKKFPRAACTCPWAEDITIA